MASRAFPTQVQAVDWAKEYKEQYKQAGEKIKYDINRTPAAEWVATVYLSIEV